MLGLLEVWSLSMLVKGPPSDKFVDNLTTFHGLMKELQFFFLKTVDHNYVTRVNVKLYVK